MKKSNKSIEDELLGLHKYIKELLLSDIRYRDNDVLLVNRVHKDELEKKSYNLEQLSILDFFRIKLEKTISSESSILRARRKINEHFPETRGLSYKRRQANQINVIDAIRNIGEDFKLSQKNYK